MRLFIKKTGFIVVMGFITFSISSVAYGGNECRIKYGWNKGNSLAGTFENKSKTIYLNKGQTKTINKNRMNYVKNLKTRKVKFYLKNATDVTLEKDQSNPLAGTYVGTVKLKKVKCLGSSSGSPSNQGGVSPGTSVHGSECVSMEVTKVPAPPAPFAPVPMPKVNKKKCKP